MSLYDRQICPGCGHSQMTRRSRCRHCDYEWPDRTVPCTIQQLLDAYARGETVIATDVDLAAYTTTVVGLVRRMEGR